MKLSIVTTMYRSSAFIAEFCQRATRAAQKIAGDDFEIIIVNDGSPDDSLNVALQLQSRDNRIVIVDLSRNFGHHKAMMTGLSYARGSHIFLIDCDLEESPEWMIDFSAMMETDNCDVVYGVQQKRKGGLVERWSGAVFYKFFNAITGLGLTENLLVVRLMSQRYVTALLRHQEQELFLAGIWHITGFVQVAKSVVKLSRDSSNYTLRKKLAMLVNAVTSFSNKPLIYIFYTGMLISVFAGFYAVWLITQRIFFAKAVAGWPSVMASIWFLSGLIICFIGIIGIYLAKIFSETKQRPYTIVRQVFGR